MKCENCGHEQSKLVELIRETTERIKVLTLDDLADRFDRAIKAHENGQAQLRKGKKLKRIIREEIEARNIHFDSWRKEWNKRIKNFSANSEGLVKNGFV